MAAGASALSPPLVMVTYITTCWTNAAAPPDGVYTSINVKCLLFFWLVLDNQ